jgi:hypothetical protein
MSTRTKRTYNLSVSTVRRVRELAESYGAAPTQDAVVELAVERLFHEARERAEAELWQRAASDPDFRAEADRLVLEFDADERWPR